ncbi:MAG: hypothetical protein ACREDM_04755 [Methylocella sp.]
MLKDTLLVCCHFGYRRQVKWQTITYAPMMNVNRATNVPNQALQPMFLTSLRYGGNGG